MIVTSVSDKIMKKSKEYIKMDRMKLLRENPVFWSRLGFCYDPPIKDENGKPLLMYKNQRKFAKYHEDFAKSGVKIHTCILHSGWVGVNEYDYSLADKTLEELYADKCTSDCYYLPRIKLNVPPLWCRENPEDTFVYYEGVAAGIRTPEKISGLSGGLRQDWLGADSPTGYMIADADFKDTRPNVNSLISLQSFASGKWLKDAGQALSQLIDYLENGKYKDRIIGYHIAFGPCGEVMQWGRASHHHGDYGINQLRAFYDWALVKYGSKNELCRAWDMEDIDRDACFLPSPEERYPTGPGAESFFRKGKTVCTDYDAFASEITVDAIEHFGKIVKEKTGKPVGTFYGYMNYMENCQYAGHLAINRILESPYVDFLAAPKSYHRCNGDNPGGEMIPTQSVNRKKLWLDELDNRTFLSGDTLGKAKNPDETVGVFWREFAKNLSHGSGFWWMDLGGGWFDHPVLMQQVAKMTETKHMLEKMPRSSVSDVLVLTDEAGMEKAGVSNDYMNFTCRDFLAELTMSGVLYDNYRFADLDEIDTSNYKLIIFANAFSVNSRIKEISDSFAANGRTLMYNYASGIWYDGVCSSENIKKFSGFTLDEDVKSQSKTYPTLHIVRDDDKIEALESDENGIKLARKTVGGQTCIQNELAKISHSRLRSLAENAGCHLFGKDGAVYYGDSRFLGVFFSHGENVIRMKEKTDYTELISGKIYRNTDTVRIFDTTAALFIKS